FGAGLLVNAAFFVYFGSFMFTLTLFLQRGLALGPLQAGAVFAPMGVAFTLSALIGQRLASRHGLGVILSGCLVTGIGLTVLTLRLATAGHSAGLAWIVSTLWLVGFGNGFVLPSLIGIALRPIPTSYSGAGSGALSSAQQFASAAGVAGIGAVFFSIASASGTLTG
ncbi:major facilitator transporter, partial [mine drainage metagenome]